MNQNKPKILYIITQGHWGGAQKYVFDIATALADDFDISVAVGEPNYMPDLQKKMLNNNKIKLIQLNFLQRSISPIKDFLALLEIKSLYKKIKPDIVHLNSAKAGILGSLAAYQLPATSYQLLYPVHGWVFNEPMKKSKKNFYKFLERFTSNIKNKIIVLSESEKNTGITDLKIPENKFTIIPIGITALKTYEKIQARQAIHSILKNKPANFLNSYIIGTIANFYPTKNLDNLITSILKIKDKFGNYNVVLIGDGKERSHLELLIAKYNLKNNVHLLGFIDNAQKYIKAFDVFVLPSKKEGMPYTLLEAKINSVPIIATSVGSIPNMIKNNKSGLLVPAENTEKLAEAILFAYNNQETMWQMAEVGAGEHLPENMANEMIKKTNLLYGKLQ
ncbi:MAG: glycosyltransferase [bacterium]|nr:glycosyltransferase [bacterium]